VVQGDFSLLPHCLATRRNPGLGICIRLTPGPDCIYKVSFFGPFYGGYNIIELDKDNYRYALVAGPDRGYLWVLARTPTLDPDTLSALVGKARALDFPVDELIYVEHDRLE
jgi:lipocalin